ncbi:MAG: RDD family protein [Deltaproteobacteria bacterium]|nr:MAG: RDD family protein [Deltaproteobacteria bacterium]
MPTPSPAAHADLERQAEFLGSLDVRLDLPLAHVGSRAMAQWIDLWIVWGAMLVLVALTWTVTTVVAPDLGDRAMGAALALSVLAIFLVQWGYFFAFELLWQGQTPGKRVFGLRVVTVEGHPPGVLPAMIRNMVRLVDVMPGVYGIGSLAMMLSPRAQRLGDRVAGTVVIREDPPPPDDGHTWPAGLQAPEIALVERWLRRRHTLTPDHRPVVARALAAHLRAVAPGVLPDGDPEQALAALAGEAT